MNGSDNNDTPDQPNGPLLEGRDFYVEKGYWVFTEAFLLRRGKCCGCGCRHCPFRKKKDRDVKVSPPSR